MSDMEQQAAFSDLFAVSMLEHRCELWRNLRARTREAMLLEHRRETRRSEFSARIARLQSNVERTLERERHLESANPTEVAFPRKMINFASGCLALAQELGADAYLSHDNLPLLAAKLLRQVHGGRIVYDAIEVPDYKSRSHRHLVPEVNHVEGFLRAFNRGILDLPDTIMTVSKGIEHHLRGMGLQSVAIENYRYYNELKTQRAIRKTCNVGDDEVLALQLNNVYPTFGFETILDYWARLPSHLKLATLGRIYPEGYREGLEQRIRELGLEDRITFLDPVPYDELAPYASGADFMLMKRTRDIPNNDWSMPNRVFDALAARLPVCSSELTQIKAFIEEHQIGTTFDPASFESFSTAVRDMAANAPAYRSRVEEAAKRCVWELHDRRIAGVFGPARRVAILGVRDVCNNRRCHRIADTLIRLGSGVTIVGPEPPESPTAGITYHVIDIEGDV